MGNKFGNFSSQEAAASDLIADGFKLSDRGMYTKRDRTGGSLLAAPRAITAIVEITSYRVDGQYAADGLDYHVYQQHFL